jgi:two-component system, OmpR family, alkaline phosphatase synthesis response regulator PhoP
MGKSRILIIEDEAGIAEVLADLLRVDGYEVDAVMDGSHGLAHCREHIYDLLILDRMLPGLSGTQVCEQLRADGFSGGILMLTALGQTQDRVTGLRTGADDYLVKPFHPDELIARVEAILRRTSQENPPDGPTSFSNVQVDFYRQSCRKADEPVSLSTKELDLLQLLTRHPGEVMSREKILSQVWRNQPFITPRTVDVHIAWLRQKLEPEPHNPVHIQTVRGEGYRFVF